LKRRRKTRLPSGVVERLSSYLNCLLQFKESGYKYISSKEIGYCTGINPAEVRRDLVRFGTLGKKGLGYPVETLIKKIQEILGSQLSKRIAVVGAGNLGTAIANFGGLKKHGFRVEALFDVDPKKIGQKIGNAYVYSISDLEKVVRDLNINIGIVATPAEVAQEVAERLVSAGVKIIVNYTENIVRVPAGIKVHNTNPVIELLHTLYFLSISSAEE
jgi:redox-sensing transcriptional repressor